MSEPGGSESLGKILARIQLPGPGPLEQRAIYDAVKRVLQRDADLVRIGSYRRGRLVLEVASAAKAFEWEAFHKDRILEDLRTQGALTDLEEVRFRTGSWSQDVAE